MPALFPSISRWPLALDETLENNCALPAHGNHNALALASGTGAELKACKQWEAFRVEETSIPCEGEGWILVRRIT